jgi:hypothetical protein
MEMWDADARDLMGPAFIEFGGKGMGSMQFVAVQADLDCRLTERDGLPMVEFSWEGDDDGERTCGRGWATVDERGRMDGRIYIHRGDDSSFAARREPGRVVRGKGER